MIKNRFLILILFIILSLSISGCSISFNTKNGGANDGGVYVTENKGDTWKQKVLIPTTGSRPGSIGSLNTSALSIDPQDEEAIYFGSVDNGLFYTYNSANEWNISHDMRNTTIYDVVVDPKSKCIIYASSGNKVYKSTDCNRNWSQIYYDNDVETFINSIAIDYYDTKNIYIGTSRGEVIKSSDMGANWKTIGRFEDNVKKIIISPHDSRIVFAATSKKGIFRSIDSGVNWVSLEDNLKNFKDGLNFKDLILAEADDSLVFLANSYGILKSSDNGDSWSKIELITPEKEATINAIAVSPKNSKEIYYVTNTTFYRSLDGGVNWATKKLPTTRAGWKILINSKNTDIIYIGARGVKD